MNTFGWSTWDLRLTESDVPDGPLCDFCDQPATTTLEHGGGRFNLVCDACHGERAAPADEDY